VHYRIKIAIIKRTGRYERNYNALPIDIRKAADDAVDDLLKDPIPTIRRLHPLSGFKNPKIYTIDVVSNHAYKISLEIDGEVAILRRIGTHKVIDRAPR
jgi:hypothetical protein